MVAFDEVRAVLGPISHFDPGIFNVMVDFHGLSGVCDVHHISHYKGKAYTFGSVYANPFLGSNFR